MEFPMVQSAAVRQGLLWLAPMQCVLFFTAIHPETTWRQKTAITSPNGNPEKRRFEKEDQHICHKNREPSLADGQLFNWSDQIGIWRHKIPNNYSVWNYNVQFSTIRKSHMIYVEGDRKNLQLAKKVTISKNLQFFFYPHKNLAIITNSWGSHLD